MGRCHFELGNYERARELGERSYQEATSARDKVWLLSSSILVAQALGECIEICSSPDDSQRDRVLFSRYLSYVYCLLFIFIFTATMIPKSLLLGTDLAWSKQKKNE